MTTLLEGRTISSRVSIEREKDRDPELEKYRVMTFGQFLRSRMCGTVSFAIPTLGLSLLMEYYVYKHRVDDYVYLRNQERRRMLRYLERHGFKNAYYDADGKLIIPK